MESMSSSVQFFGMKPTRTLVRYVERQVEKWVEREQFSGSSPRDAKVHVLIEREETGSFYYCSIEVSQGSDRWRSYESDRSLHDALKSALRNLKPSKPGPVLVAGTRPRPPILGGEGGKKPTLSEQGLHK